MKAKLLKKIRKRYQWRIDAKGVPVLLDLRKKKSTRYTKTYLLIERGYEEPACGYKELAFRLMKSDMLRTFGYNYTEHFQKMLFKRHLRFLEEHRNASLKSKSDV